MLLKCFHFGHFQLLLLLFAQISQSQLAKLYTVLFTCFHLSQFQPQFDF